MVKLGMRCPDDKEPGLPQAQTKVYIVEGYRQVYFIKSTHFQVGLFSDEHTGCGHGGKILSQVRPAKITIFRTNIGMGMARDAAGAENDSAMLDKAVRITKQSTDGADVGPQRLADHFPQPGTFDYFDIVIQQDYKRPAREFDAAITQFAKAERALNFAYPDTFMLT